MYKNSLFPSETIPKTNKLAYKNLFLFSIKMFKLKVFAHKNYKF